MKTLKKILTLILAFLIVFTSCSVVMPVLAANEDLFADSSVTSEEAAIETRAEILSEITEKREENTKHFLMSDGSFVVAQYPNAVHFLDDNGNWQDIDNTVSETVASLEQTELFGTDELYSTNKAVDNIVFAEKSNSNILVSYEANDFPISFNYQSANKSYINVVEDNIELTGDDVFLTLPEVSEEVVYEDAFYDVDLQYIVTPGELKENIILKSKNAENTFTVNYNIGGLTAKEVDSKTIHLMNGDEVIYIISAPYMSDDSGAISEGVSLKIEKNKNGKLRVVISADNEWLQSSERVYPVTVDPGIIENVIENPQSTFISSATPAVNYDTSNNLYISSGDEVYGEAYALYKLNFFESDLNADHVVSAVLNFTAVTDLDSQIRAKAYAVTSDWNASTVTWNNKPTTDERVIDVMGVENSEIIPLEFTKLYAEWTKNPENNKGIMIKAMDEGTIVINSLESVPVLTLKYVSTTGLDETSSYSEFDMGTAGSVYINNLSGNLVVARDEIDSLGESYPYDLTATYNSFSLTENRSDKWLMSYESGLLNEKHYIDPDGSIETLKATPVEGEENTYTLEENNFGFEKVIVNSDSVDVFCDSDCEKYTFNENGLVSQIVDIDTEEQNSGTTVFSRANVTDSGFDIIDGDGKKLAITKTSAQYSVTQYDGETMGDRLVYTYNENGDITSITLNGKIQALFTYDSLGRMATITNDVGYTLTFTYEGSSNCVSKVEESKNGILGRTAAYQRGVTSTKITTSGADGVFATGDDVVTTYKFNNNAKLIGTYSETVSGDGLGAVSLQYDDEKADIFGGISKISSVGINPENLLKNHNLEKVTSDWNTKAYADSSAVASGSLQLNKGYLGENSLKVEVTDFTKNGAYGYYQKFNAADGILTPGETYIASAYVNTNGLTLQKDSNVSANSNYGAFLMVEIETASKTTRYYSSAVTQTNSDADGGWERFYRSVILPESFVSVSVGLVIRNANGVAYFDCPQLELGRTPSIYNLVENNSFTYGESNWVRHNLDSTDGVSNGETVINGVPGVKKGYYQEINLGEATQKDSFVMSAWVKASALPLKEGRFFAIYPIVSYRTTSGGSVSESKEFIRFDYNDEEWQFVSAPVDLKSDDSTLIPYKVRFFLCYYRQGNTALFDNISLIRTSDVYDLTAEEEAIEDTDPNTYDKDGNVLTYTDENGVVYTYDYDENNNLSKVKKDGIEFECYEYDDLNNLTKVKKEGVATETHEYYYYDTDGDGIDDKSLIAFESYEDGSSYTYEYNTEKELVKEIYSDVNGTKTTNFDTEGRISSVVTNGTDENGAAYTDTVSYTYDSFSNITSVTENGVVTETYSYNYYDTNGDGINDKSDLASETLSDGTQNTYTYYEYTKLRTQTTTKNGKTLTYNYDIEGNLTRVDHNGFSYNYEYDAFGNTTSVKVGEQSLISYNYLPDKSNIGSVTYGNGSVIGYTYNAYGEVTEMNRNGLGTTEYRYSNDGKPIYVNDAVSGRKTFNWYDVNGKLIGEKVLVGGTNNVQENFLYSSLNTYFESGKVKQNTITTANNRFSTAYAYNDEGLPIMAKVMSGKAKTYAYDEDRRLTGTSMSTDGSTFDENFTYNEEGLISTHTVNGVEFGYTYNEQGNIIEITKNGTLQQSYTYDSNGQLLRENNLDTNRTIVYNYDGYGNILSKDEYLYTVGDLGAIVDSVNYCYDTAWKDKLISYNGKSITYDQIGNPTNYMGAEMTWFARQLQSYSTDNLDISYAYNENGLRTQKVVNGVEHNYYYVDGLLRVEEIDDDYIINYRYDSEGKLLAVSRTNLINNTSSILFAQTNTRGDVMALYNQSGDVRVRYTYDAWGKLVSATDGNGNALGETSIGRLNSVRYRGYVYDQETGLYYLQSRYYDPETGRFLNADSVDYIGYSSEVLSYNIFAYCENNAICYDDSTGEAVKRKVATKLYTIIKDSYSGEYGFLGLGFHNPEANSFTDFFDKTWSTKKWCIQKNLGYCDTYDNLAWAMGCFIHCLKSEFYYNNKWWRIELWMGRYGISVGGEIGIYNSNSNKKPKIFNCAKTSEELKMNFTLYEYDSLFTLLFNSKSMNSLFSISTNIYEDNKHWWLTGFLYNVNLTKHPPYSKNLHMRATINFKDVAMAEAFKANLKCTGITKTAFKTTINKKAVVVEWSSRYKTI